MIVFPTLVLAAILVLTTLALLEAPEAGRSLAREHRLRARRPRSRTVAVLVAVELVAVAVWGSIVLGPDR